MSPGRMLMRRADRLQSLTIGLPARDESGVSMSRVNGELRMIRAALHQACSELYSATESHRAPARRFLELVAPSLLADAARIDAAIVDAQAAIRKTTKVPTRRAGRRRSIIKTRGLI